MDEVERRTRRTGILRLMWDDYAGLPPFRRRDARDHGLTDADVRRLLEHGVLLRLGHGLLVGYRRNVLAEETRDQLVLRVQGMQRRYPIGYAAFRTAGTLHSLWLSGSSGPVHLLRVRGRPREKHDVWVETAPIPLNHRCVVAGVSSTSIARTVVDLCGRLERVESLPVVDSALRSGTTKAELRDVCTGLGVSDLRVIETIEMGDAASQSALESRSRWVFRNAHLPTPELQTTIGDEAGPFADVDFYWREAGVVGEADGMLKYDVGPDALRAEKIRQERLERLGLIVVRWTWDELMNTPLVVIERIKDALRRGAARRTGAA